MNDPFKSKWDIIIMILSVFNCFTIPYSVSFESAVFENWQFTLVNYLIDLVFLVDLIINCRTIFIDPKTGEEINTPKKILLVQLKGRFWIDLLASLPLDEITGVMSSIKLREF